jgi:hypothetical protein
MAHRRSRYSLPVSPHGQLYLALTEGATLPVFAYFNEDGVPKLGLTAVRRNTEVYFLFASLLKSINKSLKLINIPYWRLADNP